MVSELAFYSDNPIQNPMKSTLYSVKMLLELHENKKNRQGLGPSVTKLSDFLKVLADKFLTKVAEM